MIPSLARRQYLPRLREEAHRLLRKNSMTGKKNGKQYRFTVPSLANHFFRNHEQYPFQWFWDSCFHAMVWTQFDVERAKDEIRALLAWQEPDGRIPHVIFWDPQRFRRALWHWHYWESEGFFSFLPKTRKPSVSAHIQPPVIAEAVWRIWKTDQDAAFVKEVLPKLFRYYRYLAKERDPDCDDLISVISQVETGLDYSPAYDPVHGLENPGPWRLFFAVRWAQIQNKLFFNYKTSRIFSSTDHHIEDVAMNSIYAKGLFLLSELATVCTCPPEADLPLAENAEPSVPRGTLLTSRAETEAIADWAEKHAVRTREALLAKCWDEEAGLFWNLAGQDETPCKVKTIISLFPLIIPGLPRPIVERLVDHIVDPREFWTPYPLSSVSRDEPAFCPDNRLPGRYVNRWKNYRYRFLWRGAVFNNEKHFLIQGLRQYGYCGLAENLATLWMRNSYRYGFNEANHALTGSPVETNDFGWATLVVIQ